MASNVERKVTHIELKESSVDMCLHIKTMRKTIIILVGVYVDDLLVTSNDVKLVDELMNFSSK